LNAGDVKDLGVNLVGHRRRLLDAIAVLKPEADSTAGTDASAEQTPTPASARRTDQTVAPVRCSTRPAVGV